MKKSLFRYALNSIISLLLCFGLLALPAAILEANSSPIVNGGFESGDLSGWTVGSTNGTVEVLQAGNFDPGISPTEGSYFVLLSTSSENITFVSGLGNSVRTATGFSSFGDPVVDLDENGYNDNDIASLQQTFELTAGELPAELSFDWSFLTDEGTAYDDFFMVTLNGIDILHGSVPEATEFISTFENVTALDGQEYDVWSSGPTDGSAFWSGRTDFQQFLYNINSAGTYTLEFLVADQEDHSVDSGLLIDDIRLTTESCLDFSATPTTGATPLEVQFTNETTCDCTYWSWDFGDGGSSNEQNPLHTYTKPGPYTVTLTSSSPGCEIAMIKVDYIHPYTVGVGAEAYPVNPLSRVLPWFAIGASIIAGIIMLWRKRVKSNC